MAWSGTKVLVTGAGGFIGSHLTERLIRLGAQVKALVHYNALGARGWLEHSDLADAIEFHSGDICDAESVQSAVASVDVIFHLAALIAIPYSYSAPRSYLRTNVEGTLNVLQAARHAVTTRVVHTSTSEVYGTARSVPIAETHPLQAQSPYAASKIAADKIAESFHLSFGLPVATVRPFNTFGPRQSARAVIPTIIAQCLSGEEVRLGHLHPTRDLNYVADTVEGFIRVAESDAAVGRVTNLGSGREISIGDLARLIGKLADRPFEPIADPARQRPETSEVLRLLADNSEALALGWKPTVGLEEGLRRTIAWVRAHHERFRPHEYTV